jgi:hypothetical protein
VQFSKKQISIATGDLDTQLKKKVQSIAGWLTLFLQHDYNARYNQAQ